MRQRSADRPRRERSTGVAAVGAQAPEGQGRREPGPGARPRGRGPYGRRPISRAPISTGPAGEVREIRESSKPQRGRCTRGVSQPQALTGFSRAARRTRTRWASWCSRAASSTTRPGTFEAERRGSARSGTRTSEGARRDGRRADPRASEAERAARVLDRVAPAGPTDRAPDGPGRSTVGSRAAVRARSGCNSGVRPRLRNRPETHESTRGATRRPPSDAGRGGGARETTGSSRTTTSPGDSSGRRQAAAEASRRSTLGALPGARGARAGTISPRWRTAALRLLVMASPTSPSSR
jgi:hypothetical protein